MAQLCDYFHYTIEQVGKLTDRQILEILEHKRDKDGKLVEPMRTARVKQEDSFESDLRFAEMMSTFMGGAKNKDELFEQVYRKWGRERPNG